MENISIDWGRVLEYLTAVGSCLMLWLMGNKSKYGPIVGLINQVVWIAFSVVTNQWGLLAGTVPYTFIHTRNLYRWIREGRR